MTDSNRLRLAVVRETSLGVTPNTPRMRKARVTGESLSFTPQFVQSEEIRDDRMNADPIKINETNEGGINAEFSYPDDDGPLSEFLRSLMFNPWSNTPTRFNDGTADSVITGVAATGGVITVTTGAAFAVGHLIRNSGFSNAGNNGLFRITTGSATVPAVGNSLLTDEAVPPAAARVKVVGLQGASGDLVAAADGITSTSLDFTTMGIVPGMWVKIGGTGASFRLATEACNGWARVVAVSAGKLTLDNLPTGWTTDAGTGKTLRVFFGDQIKNGVTRSSVTVERGFMAQAVPTYIIQRGMVVGQADFDITTEQLITAAFTLQGLTGEQTTTSLDASPDAASTAPVMSANVNVGRIGEAGVPVTDPNYVRSLQISVNNNLRPITAVGNVGSVNIGAGEMAVEATVETYFGSNSLLTKLLNGTVSNVNARVQKNSQAVVFALPRLTFTGGSPSAGAKNQDVMLPLTAMASMDELTNAQMIIDRLEYYEA